MMFVRSSFLGNAVAAKSRCPSHAKKRYVCSFLLGRTHRLYFNVLERIIGERGLGVASGCDSSGIPVNSLRAMPGLASPDVWKSKLMVTGTNHDAH
jgi:hypothetical protein